MDFPSSGGPFYDAVLHNQVATIKLLQSIRKDLATQMPFDEIKQKHRWTYVDEVKQIMSRPSVVGYLVDNVEEWQKIDENGLVLTRSVKLPAMSESLFANIKESIGTEMWSNPDNIGDDDGRFLVTVLKKIEDKDTHKQDLELALAHWMKDNGRKLKKPGAKEQLSTLIGPDAEPAASDEDNSNKDDDGNPTPSPEQIVFGGRTSSTQDSASSSRLPSERDKSSTRASRRSLARSRSQRSTRSLVSGKEDQELEETAASDAEAGNNGDEDDVQLTPKGRERTRARSGTSANPFTLSRDGGSADESATDTVVHHRAQSVDPESVGHIGDGRLVVFDSDAEE